VKIRIQDKKLGFIEGWLSVGINLILFALKYWAGIVTGSVAMAADAWHTISDSLSSFVVLASFWFSSKKPSEKHPFGYGRAENIGAIVISVLLALIGINFFRESIIKISVQHPPSFSGFAVIIFAVSALVKEALALFSFWAGRKLESNTLRADAWHHRSDAIISALIVLSVLVFGSASWVDGVLGVIVSALIIHSAYDIFTDTSAAILGREIKPQLKEKIEKIIRETSPLIENAHHFHIHRYGDHGEITFHVSMPDGISVKEAHDIINSLEKNIREKTGFEPTVHMGPHSDEHL